MESLQTTLFWCPVCWSLYTVPVGGANSSNFSSIRRQLSAYKCQAQACPQAMLQPNLAGAFLSLGNGQESSRPHVAPFPSRPRVRIPHRAVHTMSQYQEHYLALSRGGLHLYPAGLARLMCSCSTLSSSFYSKPIQRELGAWTPVASTTFTCAHG